ncbi:MAG: hypothetical protein ACSLEL_03675 [Candidatus Malihini olakiniferum]
MLTAFFHADEHQMPQAFNLHITDDKVQIADNALLVNDKLTH